MIRLRIAALFLLLAPVFAPAQLTSHLAQKPPMGWNSWDSYGLTITEAQFRANVAVQNAKLKSFGWTYSVIDEGWFLENPQDRPTPEKLRFALDPYGRYIPVPARFPSAGSGPETSFTALAQWVHNHGLKFGIHIVRGIPRESVARNLPIEGSSFHAQDAADKSDACPWDPTNWGVKDNAAGQAWYDSLLRQYASWGVDFLKVDCISDRPYKVTEIRQIRRAINTAGRPILLSLSPGPTSLSNAAEVGSLAQMWRISDDFWDVWAPGPEQFPQSVVNQFTKLADWNPYAKPGNWPDADMLPFGELRPHPGYLQPRTSRLTHVEERTVLTLWSIARSPLILGANLTLLDPFTTALLTNRDVIRINQDATASRQALHRGDLIAWTSDLPSGERALALFNLGSTPLTVTDPFQTFGLPAGPWKIHDAWANKDLAPNTHSQTLAPHACVLLLLRH